MTIAEHPMEVCAPSAAGARRLFHTIFGGDRRTSCSPCPPFVVISLHKPRLSCPSLVVLFAGGGGGSVPGASGGGGRAGRVPARSRGLLPMLKQVLANHRKCPYSRLLEVRYTSRTARFAKRRPHTSVAPLPFIVASLPLIAAPLPFIVVALLPFSGRSQYASLGHLLFCSQHHCPLPLAEELAQLAADGPYAGGMQASHGLQLRSLSRIPTEAAS